jgi:hypothetical protein
MTRSLLVPTLVASMASLVLAGPVAFTASAQQSGDVTLVLVSQTPWNTPRNSQLDVKVTADNQGSSALQGLSLEVTIYDALISRGSYAESLTQDVGTPIQGPQTFALHESLDPGASATFHFDEKVGSLAKGAAEGRVYPMTVQLVSQGNSVAELRSPVIFIPKQPKIPLDFSWTFVLGQPFIVGPDGVFRSTELERRLSPTGSLTGQVDALSSITSAPGQSPLNLVLSPSLLDQLVRMQNGYSVRTASGLRHVSRGTGGATEAAAALMSIRTAARALGVQVSALPFASPNIPQLISSGLGKDLPAQLADGNQAVKALAGVEPDPSILRPPASAVDDATITHARALGVKTMLLDPGIVTQPKQPKSFAPPATATISGGNGGGGVTCIVPDDELAGYLSAARTLGDPRLSEQQVLGDLASIWLEQPDTARGVAMITSTEQNLPAGFLTSLAHTLPKVPWLDARTATGLADRLAPDPNPAKFRAARPGPIPSGYMAKMQDVQVMGGRYRAILVDPGSSQLLTELGRQLLLTEGSALVANQPLGLEWLDSMRGHLQDQFDRIIPNTSLPVTLTSSSGVIPIRLPNGTGEKIKILVSLQSSHLQVAGQNPRLASPAETITFDVRSRTTGTYPVQVQVLTPQGDLIGETTLVVRSTAFSRIALVITLGAIAILIALWVRRLVRRPKKT